MFLYGRPVVLDCDFNLHLGLVLANFIKVWNQYISYNGFLNILFYYFQVVIVPSSLGYSSYHDQTNDFGKIYI